MKSDAAIEDIRRTRREISRRFGQDTKAMIAHYQDLQKKYADRLAAEPFAVCLPAGTGKGPATTPS